MLPADCIEIGHGEPFFEEGYALAMVSGDDIRRLYELVAGVPDDMPVFMTCEGMIAAYVSCSATLATVNGQPYAFGLRMPVSVATDGQCITFSRVTDWHLAGLAAVMNSFSKTMRGGEGDATLS